MGHIELAAPVSHIWYFRGVPSRIGLILDMSPKALEQVIYFASYVVLDPGTVPTLEYKEVIKDKDLREIEEKYGESDVTGLKVGMGAEAIRELLMAVDLEKECEENRDQHGGAKARQGGQENRNSRIFPQKRQPPRVDGFDRTSRTPSRAQTHGPARRRQICFLRLERLV